MKPSAIAKALRIVRACSRSRLMRGCIWAKFKHALARPPGGGENLDFCDPHFFVVEVRALPKTKKPGIQEPRPFGGVFLLQ